MLDDVFKEIDKLFNRDFGKGDTVDEANNLAIGLNILHELRDKLTAQDKTKVNLYCKNPECFKHYLANNKIKEAQKDRSVSEESK